MSAGRLIGGVVASLAVAGCAAVAFGMARTDTTTAAEVGPPTAFAMPSARSARPTFAPLPTPAAPTSAARAVSSRAAATTKPHPTTTTAPARATTAPRPTAPRATAPPTTPPRAPRHPTLAPARRPATRTIARRAPAPRKPAVHSGSSLPLHFSTGRATRVITVTAHSRGNTVARLQAWSKATGGGWRKYGTAVTAHIGAQGMSTHPSESRSATPIGTFTLTQAFGYYRDPGTSLPYFKTRSSDWWISQPGRLYNTHQRCASGCAFTRGAPNEHLHYETPFYNYAVVIDYNTRNAPGGVRQGAGSAFFLHVTDGAPTAGCVAIPQARLVPLMRWLTPRAHPRILIGVA